MSRPPILDPNRSYTFSNYFELGIAVDELTNELGYGFRRTLLELPEHEGAITFLPTLNTQIIETLPFVDLANEATRREVLIAPIVSTLVRMAQANLRIEYNIKVNQQLQGNLDYYLWTQSNLLVIEAKQADLNRGFTQLAAELIAMDQWTDSDEPQLLGAITTGTIWQFGLLHRQEQRIEQGLNSYRVPEDLETLLRILLAGLSTKSQAV